MPIKEVCENIKREKLLFTKGKFAKFENGSF